MRALQFEHAPQQVTMVDYLGEVDHVVARIERLERAIDDAITAAPPALRALIEGLQALRGVAKLTATPWLSRSGSSRDSTARPS